MGNLGKLNIVISAVNKTKQQFSKVTQDLNSIRKSATKAIKVFAGFATAVSGAAVGIGLIIKKNTDFIDKLEKVSSKLGINVVLLQKLRFAADQTGIAQETLDMAMQRFIRRVGEAQQGTGEAQGALAELGIQLKKSDGSFRSTEDVLFDVADGIANARDASTQLRLAFKFFDSEGAALVNTLKNGSSGLKEFFNEAEALGFLIDAKTAKAAARFTDETSKLFKQIDSIQKLFVMAFVPVLTEATISIQNFFKEIAQEKGFKKFTEDLALNMIASVSASLIALDEFRMEFSRTFKTLSNIVSTFSLAFNGLMILFEGSKMLFGKSSEEVVLAMAEINEKNKELIASFSKPIIPSESIKSSVGFLDELEKKLISTFAAEGEESPIKKAEKDVLSFSEKLAIFAGQVNEPLKAVEMKFRTTGQMIGDTIASSMKKFEDTLVDGLMSGKFAFKDFADFVIKELLRIAVKKLVVDRITGGLTTFLGGLGGIKGAERGGTVTANRPYLVGEAGAELFVPNKTGTIVPNNRLGGGMGSGSMPVNITYNIQAFDSKDTLAAITENAPTISAIIETEFNRRGRRGFVT
tara:strand:- start:54 stop:1793 length:1740 start_codon:yes stop_codon:yes gene_type:complete